MLLLLGFCLFDLCFECSKSWLGYWFQCLWSNQVLLSKCNYILHGRIGREPNILVYESASGSKLYINPNEWIHHQFNWKKKGHDYSSNVLLGWLDLHLLFTFIYSTFGSKMFDRCRNWNVIRNNQYVLE